MKAVFIVDLDDEFLERRVRENAAENPDDRPDTALELFAGRVGDVATDELLVAFYGWPVDVTVAIELST